MVFESTSGVSTHGSHHEGANAMSTVLSERVATKKVHDSFVGELRKKAEMIWQSLSSINVGIRTSLSKKSNFFRCDAIDFLKELPPNSIHAVVTDPPYGLVEYQQREQEKMRAGKGGVWRIPPAYDGAVRRPLPRFTTLTSRDRHELSDFFSELAGLLLRVLVPGGHLMIASNPLVSSTVFYSIQQRGFEKRGEIIRLVQTLRGGDRPKGHEKMFDEVSVMPRSCWEPWGMFRKPFSGTVADNLQTWGTGGFRRISSEEPFKDLIRSSPTQSKERDIAPHPSLKPQSFLRKVVRASLPLGIGITYDPFAGSASTLAAAENIGYYSVGTEIDETYYEMGCRSFADLVMLKTN